MASWRGGNVSKRVQALVTEMGLYLRRQLWLCRISCGSTCDMRVDLREVEFSGNEEDHGGDGREWAITVGRALGLKETVQSLQETVDGACPDPSTEAFDRGSRAAS